MRTLASLVVFIGLSIAPTTLQVSAAESAPELRVATRLVPPLVFQNGDDLSGFSIDLWNALAGKLKIKTNYQLTTDVEALLQSVRSKQADVGIAAISVTSEREAALDFSQPILNAGLQILVRGTDSAGAVNPLQGLLRLLFSPVILVWLGIALILIILPAHILWFLERRQTGGMIPTEKYFPGIFHALWWAAGTLATQADQMPRNWLARVVAALWMFTSVVFVAYYTAQLTATLTVEQIHGAIRGPEDLPGKQVATTRGSTAAAYLTKQHALVQEFDNIDQAYGALLKDSVDAVVFDAPVLLFFAGHEGKARVRTVGPVFHREDYGIVFPENSPWRKKVDRALLMLREDGTYEQIYEKWFGAK
jgi:polar amino acid transport system substrate-binding protein